MIKQKSRDRIVVYNYSGPFSMTAHWLEVPLSKDTGFSLSQYNKMVNLVNRIKQRDNA